MAWLDNILGTSIDETMDDKDVCLNMLSASKGSIAMLAAAITETTNPQFRQFLTTELTSAINSHFALSDMAIQKGWYNAFGTPEDQVLEVSNDMQNMMQ